MKVLLVGLGHQMQKDHIPTIITSTGLKISGVVDTNKKCAVEVGSQLKVPAFIDVGDALKTTNPDLAVVAVPHDQHVIVLEKLAQSGVPTLAEKPMGRNPKEALQIAKMFKKTNTYLQICSQRRFSEINDLIEKNLSHLGDIYSVDVIYSLALSQEQMEAGWRSNIELSGGGAVIDMGYHMIDLINRLFGVPDTVSAQLNYRSLGKYTIDDTAKILCKIHDINASIELTKINFKKEEMIKISGNKGHMVASKQFVNLITKDGEKVFDVKENHDMDRQLAEFIRFCKNGFSDECFRKVLDHINNMEIISKIYRSDSSGKNVKINKRRTIG